MTHWETFFREKMRRILREKPRLIDIGGGLRALKKRGNRFDPNRAWMAPLLEKVDYNVLDPVPDYSPDIVGDIHALPFPDDSQDAIVCLAVLEHVEDPARAARELYRVLKPGGYCLVYVPFLFYYHAEVGYYKDYWRFTRDALELLFKPFAVKEFQSVRGALETWLHISPLGRVKFLVSLFRTLDRIFRKEDSRQVSGYYIFLVK
jgi:SAM-dependent methyltransferase